MKGFLLLFSIIALLASCRSSRTITKAVKPKDSITRATLPVIAVSDSQKLIAQTLEHVKKNRINFTTFTGKVNVDYEGMDGKGYNVNVNVRMYKDSAIWVLVNAILGFEAMRMLITKDSVKLLVKLNQKTYTARSISYLQEVTSLPLDLYSLQDLIVGNPVFLDSNIIRYSAGNGVISLVSLGQFFKNLVQFNSRDTTLVHSKLDDMHPHRSRTADLAYSEYETQKGMPFATNREIIVSEKTRLVINLNFKNYTFNEPVSFPFSVPKNYKRN